MSNDYDVTQGLGTGPDQMTTALVPVHLCTATGINWLCGVMPSNIFRFIELAS